MTKEIRIMGSRPKRIKSPDKHKLLAVKELKNVAVGVEVNLQTLREVLANVPSFLKSACCRAAVQKATNDRQEDLLHVLDEAGAICIEQGQVVKVTLVEQDFELEQEDVVEEVNRIASEAITILSEFASLPHNKINEELRAASTAEEVRSLIDAGAQPNYYGCYGSTPVHDAAYSGRPDCLRVLLECGGDKAACTSERRTPLHAAAIAGSKACIEILIKAGSNVHALDYCSMTALHFAARSAGGADCVSLLLEAGADVNAKDRFYMTPLHYAAASGSEESVKILLNANANLKAVDLLRRTPANAVFNKCDSPQRRLSRASIYRLLNSVGTTNVHKEEIIDDLNWDLSDEEKLDICYAPRKTKKAIDVLRLVSCNATAADITKARVKRALTGTKDIHKTYSACKALQKCAEEGRYDILQELMVHGFNPNARESDPWKDELFEVDTSTDPNWLGCDHDNWPLIHLAAAGGHVKAVEVLKEAGASLERVRVFDYADPFGPLEAAVVHDNLIMVKMLLLLGCVADREQISGALRLAVTPKGWRHKLEGREENHRLKLVRVLLDAGADPNAKDVFGRTAVLEATFAGWTRCLALLMQRGGDIFVQAKNGSTALHIAARQCHLQCIRMLIEAGANVSIKDASGQTPLHYLAEGRMDGKWSFTPWLRSSDVECLKALVKAGADLEAVDDAGAMPLHLAAISPGSFTVVQELLRAGVSMNACDRNGRTPLHYAANAGMQNSVQLLLDAGADPEVKDCDDCSPRGDAKGSAVTLLRPGDCNNGDDRKDEIASGSGDADLNELEEGLLSSDEDTVDEGELSSEIDDASSEKGESEVDKDVGSNEKGQGDADKNFGSTLKEDVPTSAEESLEEGEVRSEIDDASNEAGEGNIDKNIGNAKNIDSDDFKMTVSYNVNKNLKYAQDDEKNAVEIKLVHEGLNLKVAQDKEKCNSEQFQVDKEKICTNNVSNQSKSQKENQNEQLNLEHDVSDDSDESYITLSNISEVGDVSSGLDNVESENEDYSSDCRLRSRFIDHHGYQLSENEHRKLKDFKMREVSSQYCEFNFRSARYSKYETPHNFPKLDGHHPGHARWINDYEPYTVEEGEKSVMDKERLSGKFRLNEPYRDYQLTSRYRESDCQLPKREQQRYNVEAGPNREKVYYSRQNMTHEHNSLYRKPYCTLDRYTERDPEFRRKWVEGSQCKHITDDGCTEKKMIANDLMWKSVCWSQSSTHDKERWSDSRQNEKKTLKVNLHRDGVHYLDDHRTEERYRKRHIAETELNMLHRLEEGRQKTHNRSYESTEMWKKSVILDADQHKQNKEKMGEKHSADICDTCGKKKFCETNYSQDERKVYITDNSHIRRERQKDLDRPRILDQLGGRVRQDKERILYENEKLEKYGNTSDKSSGVIPFCSQQSLEYRAREDNWNKSHRKEQNHELPTRQVSREEYVRKSQWSTDRNRGGDWERAEPNSDYYSRHKSMGEISSSHSRSEINSSEKLEKLYRSSDNAVISQEDNWERQVYLDTQSGEKRLEIPEYKSNSQRNEFHVRKIRNEREKMDEQIGTRSRGIRDYRRDHREPKEWEGNAMSKYSEFYEKREEGVYKNYLERDSGYYRKKSNEWEYEKSYNLYEKSQERVYRSSARECQVDVQIRNSNRETHDYRKEQREPTELVAELEFQNSHRQYNKSDKQLYGITVSSGKCGLQDAFNEGERTKQKHYSRSKRPSRGDSLWEGRHNFMQYSEEQRNDKSPGSKEARERQEISRYRKRRMPSTNMPDECYPSKRFHWQIDVRWHN